MFEKFIKRKFTKTKTLLEKAREISVRSCVSKKMEDEHIELALAWIKGNIKLRQINIVLGRNPKTGSSLYFIAMCLRAAYREGLLKIIK